MCPLSDAEDKKHTQQQQQEFLFKKENSYAWLLYCFIKFLFSIFNKQIPSKTLSLFHISIHFVDWTPLNTTPTSDFDNSHINVLSSEFMISSLHVWKWEAGGSCIKDRLIAVHNLCGPRHRYNVNDYHTTRDGHQNLKLLLIDLNQMLLIGLVERNIMVFKSSKSDVLLQSYGL